MKFFYLFILTCLIGVGRFFIPGHDLTWAGSYEAMAHIWVGALLVLSFQKNWNALWMLILITIIEIVMFMHRG